MWLCDGFSDQQKGNGFQLSELNAYGWKNKTQQSHSHIYRSKVVCICMIAAVAMTNNQFQIDLHTRNTI